MVIPAKGRNFLNFGLDVHGVYIAALVAGSLGQLGMIYLGGEVSWGEFGIKARVEPLWVAVTIFDEVFGV